MRRVSKEPRAKGEGSVGEGFGEPFVWLPFVLCPLLFATFIAAHHCVNTITANGIPSRNPRCGTSRLVTELPQRQPFSTSGRIVYECGMCRRIWKTPPSLLFTSLNNIVQPSPPLRITSTG